MSFHKTDWSLSETRVFTQDWPNSYWIAVTYSILPFISQSTQSDEFTSRRMFLPSRNLYKCKQVACSVVVACFYPFFYTALCYCLFTSLSPFFYTDVVAIFLIFINHVNKPNIFVFAFLFLFVYHFKNTISIFVTIY